MSRGRLCWPCVATMTAALFAGITAFAVMQQPSRTQDTSVVSTRTARIDLADDETRELLTLVSRPERNRGADLPRALYQRCGRNVAETYAATRAYAFEAATYTELRRGNDGTWTALAWQNGVIDIVPPPPPPPGCAPSVCGPTEPLPSKRWQRIVSDDVAEAFARDYAAFSTSETKPLRGTQYVLDGGTVIVESCVGGQYDVFVRANAMDDDLRVHVLVDQLLAFAGVTRRDLGFGP